MATIITARGPSVAKLLGSNNYSRIGIIWTVNSTPHKGEVIDRTTQISDQVVAEGQSQFKFKKWTAYIPDIKSKDERRKYLDNEKQTWDQIPGQILVS